MIIGEKIRKAITESPFSVTEVAEQMGTSNQNLYKIFKKDSIETKHLRKISEILSIEISSFLRTEENSDSYGSPLLLNESSLLTKLKNENELLKKRVKELELLTFLLESKLPYTLLGETLYNEVSKMQEPSKVFPLSFTKSAIIKFSSELNYPPLIKEKLFEILSEEKFKKFILDEDSESRLSNMIKENPQSPSELKD